MDRSDWTSKQETVVEHVDLFTASDVCGHHDTRGYQRKIFSHWLEKEKPKTDGFLEKYRCMVINVVYNNQRQTIDSQSKNKSATLWHTKEGYETTPVIEEQQNIQSRPLLKESKLFEATLNPLQISKPSFCPIEMFQQLKSLGYIDENK